MAYPATIENAKRNFDRICAELKRVTETGRLASEAGPVSRQFVLSYLDTLRGYYNDMQTIAAVPGIGAAYPDIAAEAGTVISTTLSTIQWIAANFPKENGFLAEKTVNETTGVVSIGEFSTASLAGLRAQMTALEATIV